MQTIFLINAAYDFNLNDFLNPITVKICIVFKMKINTYNTLIVWNYTRPMLRNEALSRNKKPLKYYKYSSPLK